MPDASRLIAIAFACCMSLASSAGATESAEKHQHKTLMMHFMPCYEDRSIGYMVKTGKLEKEK